MDINSPVNIHSVPDDFKEQRLGKDIHEMFPVISPAAAPIILSAITMQCKGHLFEKYLDLFECTTLLNRKPSILGMILNGWKNGFKNIHLLKLLQPDLVFKDDMYQIRHTTDDLWAHIEAWFNQPDELASELDRSSHPKYSAIIQSPQMGASSIINELSKSHFVIPINLQEPATGYPSRDNPAYDFLSQSESQHDAFLRSCSFLHALFIHIANIIQGFKQGCPAQQFGNYMRQSGGKCHQTKFFKDVVINAHVIYGRKYMEYLSCRQLDQLSYLVGFPLCGAFHKLCIALEDGSGSNEPLAKQRKCPLSRHPSLILAFDEVHTLAEQVYGVKGSWSRYGELHRAIEALMYEPVFTLFLSTSATSL